MATTFIGLAIADSMVPAECSTSRRPLTVEQVRQMLPNVVSCCNPSHSNTLEALSSKHGIEVQIPKNAPKVALGVGDSIIVMSVRGLPRLEGYAQYTDDQIAGATFAFGMWTVTS